MVRYDALEMLKRKNDLITCLQIGIDEFAKEHGKLLESDIKNIIRHYATVLSRAEMTDLFIGMIMDSHR